jgi:hypothetical protein
VTFIWQLLIAAALALYVPPGQAQLMYALHEELTPLT